MLSGRRCEEKAYWFRIIIEKLRTGIHMKIRSTTTFSAVRGTVGHHKIQNWIERRMGLRITPMKLEPSAQKMYDDIQLNPTLKKKFNSQVANAFMNFITWWEHYDPTPLLVEQTMFTTVRGEKTKGTVDFVCLISESKLDRTLKRSPRKGIKRLIIVDWKTGSTPSDEHKVQISGYYFKAHKSVLVPFLRQHKYYEYDNKPYGIDVYLGSKAPNTVMFEIDQAEFFAAAELYKKATRNPIDRTRGGIINEGGMECYFCPFTDRCSTVTKTEMTILELGKASNYDKGTSIQALH